MAEFPRITRQAHVLDGRACLRNTGVTVSTVVALTATGRSQDEITRIFPSLIVDDVREALSYAAWLIDEKEVHIPIKQRPVPLYIRAHAEAHALEASPNGTSDPEIQAKPDLPAKSPEAPVADESMELFHPAYPDQPTVVVTPHGLFDRRWFTSTIDWADIRELRYVSGKKSIYVTLRNPEYYLSSMPFFHRLLMEFKLAINRRTFLLDSASLGIRTKDLYLTVNRLWLRHNGRLRFRKKRRVRTGKKAGQTVQDKLWNSLLPM